MKTGLMEIALCNGLITADAKTGMINLKSIEKLAMSMVGVEEVRLYGKRLELWLENKDTKEFLEELSLARKSSLEELVVKKGRGRYSSSWGDILVALKYAMYVNKKLEVEVLRVFVEKKILDFRLLGIDYNKKLNILLDNLEDRKGLENRQTFIDVAIKIKEAVFGEYHEGWDNEISDADALEKRSKIQNELIFLMEKNYIKNYNDVLNYFTKL